MPRWYIIHLGFAVQAGQYAAETYESVKDASVQAGAKASQVASDAYDTAADASQHAYKHASNAAKQVSVTGSSIAQGHAMTIYRIPSASRLPFSQSNAPVT